jgi:hypothetical protein
MRKKPLKALKIYRLFSSTLAFTHQRKRKHCIIPHRPNHVIKPPSCQNSSLQSSLLVKEDFEEKQQQGFCLALFL